MKQVVQVSDTGESDAKQVAQVRDTAENMLHNSENTEYSLLTLSYNQLHQFMCR